MFIHTYYNTLNRTFNPINQVIQTIVNYIDFVELKNTQIIYTCSTNNKQITEMNNFSNYNHKSAQSEYRLMN